MADKIINNPAGAFGASDTASKLWSKEAQFVSATTLAAGKVVSFATTVGQVTTAATNAPNAVIGITADAITSGRVGGIITEGAAMSVAVNGAVAQFDLLKASATTAGNLAATATPGAGEVVAIALAASASNVCDVWVLNSKS